MQQQFGAGYQEYLFKTKPEFVCTLCFLVPKNPLECQSCGVLYCGSEVDANKTNFQCLACGGVATLGDFNTNIEKYLMLSMICQICQKELMLAQFEGHQCKKIAIQCKFSKFCKSKDINNSQFEQQGVCGTACYMLDLKEKYGNNKKQLYKKVKQALRDNRVVLAQNQNDKF